MKISFKKIKALRETLAQEQRPRVAWVQASLLHGFGAPKQVCALDPQNPQKPGHVADFAREGDAKLAAQLHNAMPELLDALAALEPIVERQTPHADDKIALANAFLELVGDDPE